MLKLLKFFWRCYHTFLLKKKNVYVAQGVKFNPKTQFEDHIKVHKGSVIGGSMIGRNTYIASRAYLPNCSIGRFCCIAHDVVVVPDTHPARNFVSSSPVFYSTKRQCGQTYVSEMKYHEMLDVDGRFAIIGNDVWIGAWVRIKGGVRIGDGAIIAMGSVVVKNVPPYAVVGGVPAKVIRYRFSDDIISTLLKKKWWERPDSWLRENAEYVKNVGDFLKRM